MRIHVAPIAIAVASTVVTGCSAYRTARPDVPPINALGQPPSALGQLCVVRPEWGGRDVTLVVRDNQHLVGASRGPSYFCYFAEPGAHTIESAISDRGMADPVRRLELAVEPGGSYFLTQTVSPSDHGLARITGEEAKRQIETCGYQVVVRSPEGSLPGMTPVAAAQRARQ